MNKRIDFDNLGGNPIDQQSLEFMQSSYRDCLAGLASFIGDKVIITGVVNVAGILSDGWIVYNGELIRFVGGPAAAGVVVQELATHTPNFQDGNPHDVEFEKTATCGAPATFPFSDLRRLNTIKDMWLPGDVKEVDCDEAYILANFDMTPGSPTLGLGKNERLGWAICNGINNTKDRGGRISIGYSTVTIDPEDNVWDVIYNTIGATGGEKKHQLTIPELPAHSHTYTKTVGGGSYGDNSNDQADQTANTSSVGGDQPHENRPPYIVTLFIQKL